MEPAVVRGDDGIRRCAWGASSPEYIAYHDTEWGRAITSEHGVFERLCLEGFQSGLSWITILRKRENFRSAFAQFDPFAIAAFTDRDVERLLNDAGIVRHRGKIDATIANAQATVALLRDGQSLAATVWASAPQQPTASPKVGSDVPAKTPESIELSKTLKRLGFKFVGPTTMYAAMQAMGVVNDHFQSCHARSVCVTQRIAARVDPG